MQGLASLGYAQAIVSSTRAKRRVIDVRFAATNEVGDDAARFGSRRYSDRVHVLTGRTERFRHATRGVG